MADSEKTIVLYPSWKSFSLSYLIGILTIPLLGLGLYIIWKAFKKQTSHSYRITNTGIIAADQKYSQNIDLINIKSVEVEQNGLDRFFNTGTVTVSAAVSEVELLGMNNPFQLKESIERAVEAENIKAQKIEQQKPPEPEYDAGSLDRIDYLTGLWQQGLISDEDFENEKKHFE